jgi:DNA polymerase-3 subunit epsilon
MTEITNDRRAAVNGGADGSAAPDDVAHPLTPLTELEYVVVDVETTGFTPDTDAITEIGAVRIRDGRVVAEFTSLVNPGTPVPEQVAQLTGISDQMLAPAPPVAAVLPGLLTFADGCVLTAHNAPFDVKFLRAAFAASGLDWPGYPVLDTLRLARQLMRTPDEVRDCKLGTLAGYFGTPVQPTHRALADARATAAVLSQLLARLAERDVTTLGELIPWLEEHEAAQAAAAEASARRPRRLRWLRWLTRMVRRPRPPRQPR